MQAFGINVPRMVTLTYGFGAGLAALAGVMAAPVYQVSPNMGSELIIVVFAVVVVTMQNYLAQIGAWVTVVQGTISVICVLAFRRGIVGELGAWLKKSL